MQCPICNKDTKVIDTRPSSDGMGIRRRRTCVSCEYRFSTLEEAEILDLTIVKNDGRREAFSREKILKGIVRALEKRPYTQERLKKLMYTIERDIQRRKSPELTSAEIGDMVMARLRGFDKVAYIRFASVYRQFEDVQTFQTELNALLQKRQKRTG
ncbi:transcriptional regulator NrdR [Candidatus Uhrbacteria bacterium RIFCSPHIGHO2_02_FULL_53_13]|uniref:Transcriptional repressor NrdR n=2 Tax=Candidatus Uhriibacteriota TaxID=1752732 RepID=A0A1F7TVE5_9BACT|nr:MAG: transcriptional regulator NrdR [Candidatus Uhrbacteria bacterium RIFCSPHIGHO2_02_FULL_53_13]OGL90015.1 MAG: transcriptional regulator NrdR [Candidatus Uhrbacteria bacterium RIFCSPLOWO2_02_FULL_53_10]